MSALLPTTLVERPWGRTALPAPFVAPPGEIIGEVWFEPPRDFDRLLVKYLFTSQALSVQVHPGGPQGKEECWLVTRAEPDAAVGVGFREPLSPATVRAAALDGRIVELMAWHPVQAGDFLHIPPGTVHAIGAGIDLIEVQQNCDVTYRLYDYGRPRALHLDQGLAVADLGPHDPALRRLLPPDGSARLVEGASFRLDRIDGPPASDIHKRYAGTVLVIPLRGSVRIDGETAEPGQCAVAPSLDAVTFPEDSQALLAQPTMAASAGG